MSNHSTTLNPLNFPLSLPGINLTDEQKNTIRQLVIEGKTVQAKEIVLNELDGVFSGQSR